MTVSTRPLAMLADVFLPAVATGLPRDSVANVAAIVTLNKDELDGPAGHAPDGLMRDVDQGLRRVLGL
jgi:mRNA interferase MazF